MPTIQVNGAFGDLTNLDGLFIILDPPSDSPGAGGGEVMPGPPVEWNTASPVGDVDWSFFTVAADGAAQIRYSGRGATLVSPNYAVCAHHARGSGGFHFLQPDGVEITRTSTMTEGVDYWNIADDLGLIKLSSPITTIDPIPIFLDCSVAAGKPCVAIEMDRHLNRMVVSSTLDNSDSTTNISRTSGTADALEGGDSGKPVVCLVNGSPVLVMTAILNGGASSGSGPNPSFYIADMQAILDADDEELTLWDVTLVGAPATRSARSAVVGASLAPDSMPCILY
jgi:hypothetical protein